MPLTPEERKDKLSRLLNLLQTSKYRYAKEKGRVGIEQLTPAVGTSMNCESAARIFMQIGADMGVEGLQSLYYEAAARNARGDKMGYLVLQSPGLKALGNAAEISNGSVSGWEFDNHWRVKDPVTGLIYDPTFGTTSPGNPKGILGTEMETGKNFAMTTTYGKKYTVTRQGPSVSCSTVAAPLAPAYVITDQHFRPKPLLGLRPHQA